jgi:formate hydrogenlyase transcriptional activator
MKKINDRSGQITKLRRHAEKIIRGKVARTSENLKTLSPEEIRKTIHELQVHQVELEMQNEELRHAQVELDAARSRYFDLYDLAPVGYCTVSGKGLILEANLTAAILLGMDLRTLMKQAFSRFILKDDQDIHYVFRKKLFDTGEPQSCELRMLKKDRTVFWARLEASVAQAADDTPVSRVVISNITARKQAEDELREKERKLGFMTLISELSARFINLPAEMVDTSIEDSQRLICEGLHLEISALWQVSPDRPGSLVMTHHHLSPGLPPDFPAIPRDMDAWEYFPWCLEKMLKGERIVLSRIMEAPAEAARDMETWHRYGIRSALILPLSTGDGTLFGALAFDSVQYEIEWSPELVEILQLVAQVFANTLARIQAKSALIESEVRYRNIFDGAIEGIYRTSLQGKIILGNPALANILGYDSAQEVIDEVVDTARQVWVEPEERSRFTRMLEEQGAILGYECRFRRKDGTIIWVSLNSRAICGQDGRVAFFEGFLEDISMRKKLEAQLKQSLEEVQQLRDRLHDENVYLREQLRRDDIHAAIVGESKPILKTLEEAKKVAPTDSTVLLLGETGTGKELLAHAIHEMSSRKDRLLVLVNCASLPPTLIESELFGREKGAYTGSLTRMTGRFELADGSTLFLDEIGDLPLELQSKLLRVLEQGQFERLGSSRTIKVNVRLIAATNRDLAQDVSDGKFRKDLYYRLNVFPITLPPLRDRKNDIPSLVWSFVNQFEKSLGKQIESIPKKSMEALMNYSWPGNIRELKNVIEHAMIMSSSSTLEIAPPIRKANELSGSYSLTDIERRHILEVLSSSGWRISGKNGAAEILGMKRTTLQSKIRALGIKRPPS